VQITKIILFLPNRSLSLSIAFFPTDEKIPQIRLLLLKSYLQLEAGLRNLLYLELGVVLEPDHLVLALHLHALSCGWPSAQLSTSAAA
jgi:hypothetical protein